MRLSGGARNANVYAALRPLGRAITHGRCKGVGVAGLVLGGGIGFSQRLQGLACDQLVETEIVIASGELLRCNEVDNADLFWACRGGGGGNFGVNTSLTFQTFPVAVVTVFRLVWRSGLDELLPAALALLPTTPDRLGCKLFVEAGKDEQWEKQPQAQTRGSRRGLAHGRRLPGLARAGLGLALVFAIAARGLAPSVADLAERRLIPLRSSSASKWR